ncbi:MAG: hypothetical protein ABI687_05890 [Flavitalea sp.]
MKSIIDLKNLLLKASAILLCSFLLIHPVRGQYYYKDQLVPHQTVQQLARYKEQKIRKVKLHSFENDGQPSADFTGEQSINNNFTQVITHINSPVTGESQLTTLYDAKGWIIKTIDTTDGSGSAAEYSYNIKGQIEKIISASSSAGLAREKEEHIWIYNQEGRPEKMIRIKNNTDTTIVLFVLDENGNVTEENSSRNGVGLPSVYYYYDAGKRLTDIVSYSVKAKRLLPLYVFEYNESGQPLSMIVVPEGTDNYQKWYYEYNDEGLKTRESCFNKKKQLQGKIEYEYQ